MLWMMLFVGGAAAVTVAALVALLGSAGSAAPEGAAGRVIGQALMFVIGAIPPTVLAVLWYARMADYAWAIRGPGPFAHLGGGPAMLAAFTFVIVWTLGFWGAGVWRGRRARAERPPLSGVGRAG